MHYCDSLKVADAAKRSELMGKMEASSRSGIMIQPTWRKLYRTVAPGVNGIAGCILLMKCTLKKSGFHNIIITEGITSPQYSLTEIKCYYLY